MPSRSCIALAWSLGLGTASAAPPAPVDREAIEADRARCKAECAPIESKTDRSTCELVCDTRADNRLEGPSIQSWKTEKQLGGPPPGVPVGAEPGHQGTVTTTVTRDRSGEHETITTTDAGDHSGPATRTTTRAATRTTPSSPSRSGPAPAVAFSSRLVLAQCQQRCEPAGEDPARSPASASTARIACKAQCLRRHPTPRAPARPRNEAPRAGLR